MKTKAQIINYLHDQRLYRKFCDNIRQGSDTFFDQLTTNNYPYVIQDAFQWDGSLEGTDFWEEEDIKFREWFRAK